MSFSELATYFQKLENTPSRNEMTEILAELFTKAGPDEIGKICYLLLGRVAPLFDAIEFGVADKFMMRAIALSYDVPLETVTKIFKKTGDMGITAESFYKGKDDQLKINQIYSLLFEVTQASGVGSQEKKIQLLASILSRIDKLSARYLARIPLDKLRLGFSDMTILDALSWMLTGDKSGREKLEGAYNVRPDIGFIAESVKLHGIQGLSHVRVKVGAPILACLCQRIPTADEMIEKMGTVAVEPKYDGVRIQIHFRKSDIGNRISDVKTFSRNLENTTAMFPELSAIGSQLSAHEVILDGEAVGIDPKTGKSISFQETMTRKRKYGITEAIANVPLKFFIFDILFINGRELLDTPFSRRRAILEETVAPGKNLVLSPQIVTDKPEEIRRYHDEQIAQGLEGVVVKKWDATYEPGRRGFSWVKFKQEEGKTGKLTDTIDAVVMGYTRGEGKRTAFGIGQVLLGVKKGENFVSITKLGSGATEKELGILFRALRKLRVKNQPKEYDKVHKAYTPDFWVTPHVVLEIAGDDLTKSPSHGAGIAVRFPRLVRIRTDKSPGEATTVAEIHKFFRQQITSKKI